jgi:hypothetical protein
MDTTENRISHTKNPYRFVILFALVFLAVSLLICAALMYPSIRDPMPDWIWKVRLVSAFEETGINLQKIDIRDDTDREIVVSVTDMADGKKVDPYILVSGVHFMVAAFHANPRPHPIPVDWVTVNVQPETEEPYTVRVKFENIDRVTTEEISEQEYVDTWEMSGNAPLFIPPEHK